MEVSQLYLHPIKSLRSVPVSTITVTNRGLLYDRQYILVRVLSDGDIQNLVIKTTSQLCLFQQLIDEEAGVFTVHHTKSPSEKITLPLRPTASDLAGSRSHEVEIFGSTATGYDMGEEAATFFSKYLGYTTRLLCIGVDSYRDTNPILTPPGHLQKIAYPDAAPIMLSTSSSLDNISSRLDDGDEMDITKFRPNIHISTPGADAFDEEFWVEVDIGGTHLDCSMNTVRCQSINVDYATGEYAPPQKQVYKRMMADRRVNPLLKFKPCFGKYAFCGQEGSTIRLGDPVVVKRRNVERYVAMTNK